MEDDSSRGGSSRGGPKTRFQKPRRKNLQTSQNQPFQSSGYHPQPPSPHFIPRNYSYNQPFDLQQFQNPFQQFDPSIQNFANQPFPIFNQSPSSPNFQDYREANDDSTSEPFNEPPPPRQRQGKAPARRWSSDEEIALVKAWFIHSQNNELGNAIPKDGFYKMVLHEFHTIMNDDSRSLDQIYSKWKDLSHELKKFNGIYHQTNDNRKSGENDENVITRALIAYQDTYKAKGFIHLPAWREVRFKPNYAKIPKPGDGSQPTPKRAKSTEAGGSSQASAPVDLDADDDDIQPEADPFFFEPERPIRKGKRSSAFSLKPNASSSSHEEFVKKFDEFNTVTRADIEERAQLRKEKAQLVKAEKELRLSILRKKEKAMDEAEKQKDIEFFTSDHSTFKGSKLRVILERKREIAEKWGWELSD